MLQVTRLRPLVNKMTVVLTCHSRPVWLPRGHRQIFTMQRLSLKGSIYFSTLRQEKYTGNSLKTDAWHYEQCYNFPDVIALSDVSISGY